MMKKFSGPTLVGATLLAFLTSCTNIKDDGTRTRTEGTLAGAAVGAGIGALIGSASGNAGRGALIGAGSGAVIGLAYGDHVAKKKAQYASEEQWLNACIASATQVNQQARGYNSTMSSKIASLERQISIAKTNNDKQSLKAAQVSIQELQRQSTQEQQKVDQEIQIQQEVLAASGSSSKSGELRSSVSDLKGTRSTMQRNSDRLASLNNQIDL